MGMRMRNTGMTRPVDGLGRIVIPKEMRDRMDIREDDRMEIWVTEDGLVMRKAASTRCEVCGRTDGDFLKVDACMICDSCARQIADRMRRGE